MQNIRQQLQAIKAEAYGAHEANFFPRTIGYAQCVLTTLLAQQEDILHAQAEGIIEVTVRTQSKTFTLAVAEVSTQITEILYVLVGKRCDAQAREILYQHATFNKEGESADRIKNLELLLTPVDAQGIPVRELPAQDQAA